ncbi:MAG: GNAT family N-acetyltransferase [Chitinophagaceae bacterium]
MLFPTIVTAKQELQQILALQQTNLKKNISEEEMKEQGFVTLEHDLETLEQMHNLAPSIIIKDDEKVVAYALSMLQECRQLIPDLEPMFAAFDTMTWNNKPLNSYRFYVMGQVCIDKAYRGRGLFTELYQHHKKVYQPGYDLLITDISEHNQRSLRAHEKVGFKTIHTYLYELDEWFVVGWDWN